MGRRRAFGPVSGQSTALRPSCDTPLRRWLDAQDGSVRGLAAAAGLDQQTLQHIAAGKQLPSLLAAFRLEQVTEGAVLAVSWLGTDLARSLWAQMEERSDG